jgi:hypothetical protein
MTKITVRATSIKVYEVEVEAEDEAKAIESLDDWISDDFEGYEVSASWHLEA